jgi:hypothetical protein
MADVQWTTNVAVSMAVTGAPSIMAPCGHPLQPVAFVVSFFRGTLPSMTVDWDVQGWDLMVIHVDEWNKCGLDGQELTLSHKDFGEGTAPTAIPPELQGMARTLGIPLPQEELLGPVPEWVHTAIKSYQPYTPDPVCPPVRTANTYHG